MVIAFGASAEFGAELLHLQLLQLSDGLLTFLEIEGSSPPITLRLPEWLLALGVHRRGQAALLSICCQMLAAPPYAWIQKSRSL
jgi:hypothetical protein